MRSWRRLSAALASTSAATLASCDCLAPSVVFKAVATWAAAWTRSKSFAASVSSDARATTLRAFNCSDSAATCAGVSASASCL